MSPPWEPEWNPIHFWVPRAKAGGHATVQSSAVKLTCCTCCYKSAGIVLLCVTSAGIITEDFEWPWAPVPSVQFCSVAHSCLTLYSPMNTAHQASLSITNSWSLPKLMSIQLVMPYNHFILCCPLLLLPSTFPSIRVFSNEPALHIRWPKYWSFSFNISLFNEYLEMISFRMD